MKPVRIATETGLFERIRVSSQCSSRQLQRRRGQALLIDSFKMAGLSFKPSGFVPEQLGDSGKPGLIPVSSDAQALLRLGNGGCRHLDSLVGALPVGIGAANLQAHGRFSLFLLGARRSHQLLSLPAAGLVGETVE